MVRAGKSDLNPLSWASVAQRRKQKDFRIIQSMMVCNWVDFTSPVAVVVKRITSDDTYLVRVSL